MTMKRTTATQNNRKDTQTDASDHYGIEVKGRTQSGLSLSNVLEGFRCTAYLKEEHRTDLKKTVLRRAARTDMSNAKVPP